MTIACSMRSRLRGLLGRESYKGTLLLVPCNDIHTFGMRKPIDMAFIGRDGSVIEAHRDIPPNRRLKNRLAVATIERFSTPDAWYNPGDFIQHARLETQRKDPA